MSIAPILQSVRVKAPPAEAFDLFTAQMAGNLCTQYICSQHLCITHSKLSSVSVLDLIFSISFIQPGRPPHCG